MGSGCFPTCQASYRFLTLVHRSIFGRLRPELCASLASEKLDLEHVTLCLGAISYTKLVLLCVSSLLHEQVLPVAEISR